MKQRTKGTKAISKARIPPPLYQTMESSHTGMDGIVDVVVAAAVVIIVASAIICSK